MGCAWNCLPVDMLTAKIRGCSSGDSSSTVLFSTCLAPCCSGSTPLKTKMLCQAVKAKEHGYAHGQCILHHTRNNMIWQHTACCHRLLGF